MKLFLCALSATLVVANFDVLNLVHLEQQFKVKLNVDFQKQGPVSPKISQIL